MMLESQYLVHAMLPFMYQNDNFDSVVALITLLRDKRKTGQQNENEFTLEGQLADFLNNEGLYERYLKQESMVKQIDLLGKKPTLE